jgi:hypothetical protein
VKPGQHESDAAPKAATTPRPDLATARAAWIELGKAIDSAEFAPPESDTWQGRAKLAHGVIDGALGINDPRGGDALRKILREAADTYHERRLGAIGEGILLLVEAVDRLTNAVDEHGSKSAAAIDYISDHLNEIGEKA